MPDTSALGADVILPAIGLAAGAATLAGGALALRLRASLDLFLGFSAGAVVGVSLFDLLPEALRLGLAADAPGLTAAAGLGFAIYFLIDRVALIAQSGREGHRGHLGAASLTVHSLMDGLGIGLAFQVSLTAAIIVAVAVLAHDMVDGLNTVTLSLSGGTGLKTARRWLIADAVAPLLGIALSRLIAVPAPELAKLLALFAGFFLYIGASELLPHSHAKRPHVSTIAATLAGLALIYGVVRLAGG